MNLGFEIHNFAKRLWSFNRSITGEGVRQTLTLIQKELPNLRIVEVPSGTKAFDWTVPKEWSVKDAFIVTPSGEKICQFKNNNLHLVGYSVPIKTTLTLAELQSHLYSLPEQPDAIPYITSYYKERWGFCLSQHQREQLVDGVYQVHIDSELFDGSLTYAELLLPGQTSEEVFLSTYICHPSMANNELSGPCVATFLAKKLMQLPRRYSYRIIFVPETIGSITYLSRHLEEMKRLVVAGFNITCVGDNRDYSYLPSRKGQTSSDLMAQHVLRHICPTYKRYDWRARGSDERQYCAPGVDLPIASIMRTRYGVYPEYHTSLDDLINVVTPEGLAGGFNAIWRALEGLEHNLFPKMTVLCEPQLGKRGLYPTLSTKTSAAQVKLMMDFITWSDGSMSLLEIAERCECAIWELYPLVELLTQHELITLSDQPQFWNRS